LKKILNIFYNKEVFKMTLPIGTYFYGNEKFPNSIFYSECIRNGAFSVPYRDYDANMLASQIEVESSFNPKAESPVGAKGLCQFMPQTWLEYGKGDIFNGEDNINACCKYINYLYKKYGTLSLALFHYVGGSDEYVSKVVNGATWWLENGDKKF